MKLGNDFFLIMKIMMAVIKALIAVFGDDDDKREANTNGF